MEHNLDHTLALLARTPAALDALLRGLPEAFTHANEGDNTWSALDIVGHLIHCEKTDWLPRTKMILAYGDSRPFEPFDRQGHVRESKGKTLTALLDEFAGLRSQNIEELRAMHLTPSQLSLRGLHPALGSVTLSQLLATWAAHDANHLHQLARVIALQYRDLVGPWSRFMGVMHCTAHSAPG
ncbi:MAG TPA: DinB family protein [Acidobacteriaceae bacterium]|nr:DinB family protein [Acidobacteriaceae bacterium]